MMPARSAVALIFLFFPTILLSQQHMRKYDAVLSLSGWYSASSVQEQMTSSSGVSDIEISQRSVTIAARGGFFLSRRFVVGAELDWMNTRDEEHPQVNPSFERSRRLEDGLYIGPWARWYIPATDRWWFFLEATAGYAYRMRDDEVSSASSAYIARSYLDGGAVRTGVGLAFLIDRRIAADLTARYTGTWLNGYTQRPGMKNIDADISMQGVEVLLGFQALL